MDGIENRERAQRGRLAIMVAAQREPADDRPMHVADTLANLMHYCREQEIDFAAALTRATNNFTGEVEDDE